MSCVSVSSFFVARTLSSKFVDSCSVGFLCVGETAFAATLPRRGEGAACEATELSAGDEVKEALAASVLHGGGGGRVAVPGVSVVHVPRGEGGVAFAAVVQRDGGGEGYAACAASRLPRSSARRTGR